MTSLIFKEIPNIPGYLISNQGTVFSSKTNAYLKQSLNRCGYANIRVSNCGKPVTIRIHREVALAFIPNPLGLREVNHKDCDKTNSHVSNLEWCSRTDNVRHAFTEGRFKQRDAAHRKATDAERLQACELYLQGMPVPDIAKKFKAAPNTVYAWFNKLIPKQDRERLRSINISLGKTVWLKK